MDSIEQLAEQKLWEGEEHRPLRFRDDALFQQVFRKCSKKNGVENGKMTKDRFLRIYHDAFMNAGYYDHPVIHGIRRGLGLLVDELYTAVQRSQHLTQADPEVFNTSYVANCSSVDGQAAFHGHDISDRRHIQYFQGSEQFYEDGLPTVLPAAKVREIAETVEKLTALTTQERYSLRRKLKKEALENYQFSWSQERRDAKVQGLTKPEKPKECLPHSCLLIPERARLAHWMTMAGTVSREDKWAAAKAWVTVYRRDPTEYYLPGLHPKEGHCPVSTYGVVMASISQNRRSQHIEACVRKATAERQSYRLTDIQYCHICFELIVGRWELHCQTHINGQELKRCGMIKECGTLIRPAFCPFCLGDQTLPASQRLQSHTRNVQLWDHINTHLQRISGPIDCPHPLCRVILQDQEACENHFIDEHLIQAPPDGFVRKSSSDSKISLDTPVSYPDQQVKKRKLSMTLTPSLLSEQRNLEHANPTTLSTVLPDDVAQLAAHPTPDRHSDGACSDTATHYDHYHSSKRLCTTISPSMVWVQDQIEDRSTADTVSDAVFTEFINLSALEISDQQSVPTTSPKMQESKSETTDRQLPMIRLLVSPKEEVPTVRRPRRRDSAKRTTSAGNGCRKLAKGSRQQVRNGKIMLRFRKTASKQR